MPIITGALGLSGRGFRTWMRKLQLVKYCELMHKACLLGTVEMILLSNKYQPLEQEQ